eukprot:Em0007g1025a
MANKKTLPSDPEFLLQYLDDMDSDFSDEDFDGYIEENNEGCETQAGETEAMEVEEMEQEIVEDQELEDFGIEETEEDDSPIIPPFHQNTGVTRDMNDLQPVDFFFELFPQDLLTYIVQESNRYGQQYLMNHAAYLEEHPRARANQFKRKPIVEDEIKKFIALVIGMGIVNMPDMQQYWSTSWPFTSTNFSSIMSRDRFLLLLKFLHLADNTRMAAKGQRGYDTLFKYMPKKPHKWGMKARVLAEAETGYTWNFHLYTGKEEARPAGLPLGTHVVIDLVKDLAGKGHHIYFDNFYTSPQLCKALLTRGFGSCGTVRLDRKEIPDSFKRTVIQTGEVAYYKDGHVLGLKWKDKRVVSLLTTIHDESMVTKSRRMKGAPNGIQVIDKPYGIDEYNKYMGGVDKAGQLVQYYGYNNFSKKWWKRVFFHMLDVTLVNAYIVYYKSITADTPARLLGHNHFPEPSGGRHDCKARDGQGYRHLVPA